VVRALLPMLDAAKSPSRPGPSTLVGSRTTARRF